MKGSLTRVQMHNESMKDANSKVSKFIVLFSVGPGPISALVERRYMYQILAENQLSSQFSEDGSPFPSISSFSLCSLVQSIYKCDWDFFKKVTYGVAINTTQQFSENLRLLSQTRLDEDASGVLGNQLEVYRMLSESAGGFILHLPNVQDP
ncbi:hypothetical protein E5288_WYG014696 [Bos mutus]|uniref:Uncharacterized protein n=1 Tax=Bos mutus TaxID=72004 RepID=A0A6B0R017_9CETA|nr:hypothetical protein [Bos mutus]